MRLLGLSVLFTLTLGSVACDGCGESNDGDWTGGGPVSGGGGSGGSGGGSGGTGGNGFSTSTGTMCQPGEPCEGGVCDATGSCCPYESVCGTTCCPGSEVCSFLECVTPGIDCTDDKQCAADEYCDFSLGETEGEGGDGGGSGGGSEMCTSSAPQPTGKCMPKPPVCPDGTDPGDPPSCVTQCEYHPPTGVFSPELKYAWGDPANTTSNVMMSPVVVQLDDDNCDDVIDEKDIPEIVFFTFDGNDYNNNSGTSATLHAISILEGAVVEKLSIKTTGDTADIPGRSIAAGDIDGDGTNEIVTCTKQGRLRAYEADGTIQWLSEPRACFMPSIADLDQDGMPEVVDNGIVVDGATGATKATFETSPYVVVSDVDDDGFLDIVSATRVHAADGSIKIDTGLTATHAAIGDFDLDGIPEVVAVDFNTHAIHVWRVTGPGTFEIVRQGIDLNEGISPNPCCVANVNSAGCTKGGGPPTVAHFNDDPYPDVGIAGGIGYVVFDGEKLMDLTQPASATRLWLTNTQDCSSAQTGSSVFDFDGDGIAEVVYADELTMHIYDGPTGTELFGACNTNGTLVEYPLVADVDNDGHADIVVVSNSYSSFNCNGTKTAGVRVFGDLEGKWVRTRRVWNQHAYHVTNVDEDGSIPAIEVPNVTSPGLNNFRQNVQPSGQFSAPDLIVSVTPVCDGSYGLRARVLNVGEAPVEPGVVVGFYVEAPGGGSPLGSVSTALTLYPLTYEDVVLPLDEVPTDGVYAIVDDGMPPHPWHECRTDNNQSALVDPACAVPQ
ncbi:MAG: VCBS repeat-containing protein [Polyangiaceae bacterium]|nr:VCBS repeat-containing protein [Polyangiaceae bacterium]